MSVNEDSNSILGTFFQLLSGVVKSIAHKFVLLGDFIAFHGKTVFYHFVFIISYIICFTTLTNTSSENARFLILIFISFLHIMFLFVLLTANATVPSLNTDSAPIIMFSPYFVGTGWLILAFSISFMLHAYYSLYKKFTANQMPIDFGSLDSSKNEFIKYLRISTIWMWIFYIFERIKIIYVTFFSYNQIISTIVLIFGIIFIALSTYTAYIGYNVSNSVQKLALPPLNSFQSFYSYFQNLAEDGGTIEGFFDASGGGVVSGAAAATAGLSVKDMSANVINQQINDHYESVDSDDVINRPSTIKMMERIGVSPETEFSTSGMTIGQFCQNQITTLSQENTGNGSGTGFYMLLLSKSNKDIYYLTKSDTLKDNTNNTIATNNSLNNYLGYYNVSILSYNSAYKNVSSSVDTFLGSMQDNTDNTLKGIFMLDHANNLYNIRGMNTPSNKVTVSITPIVNTNYNPTNIVTSLGANGIGTYLLAPDNSDLFFIKTQYTTTNTVEIYCLDIASRYQKMTIATGTPFVFDGANSCTWSAPLDASNSVDKAYMDYLQVSSYNLVGGVGTYLLNSKRDLYFVKTVNTDSHLLEIHGLSAASNYQSFCCHYITALRIFYNVDNSTKPIGNKWYSFGVGTLDLDLDDNLVYIKPTSTDNAQMVSSLSVFTLSAAKTYRKFIT
jgi:hypothetical protein